MLRIWLAGMMVAALGSQVDAGIQLASYAEGKQYLVTVTDKELLAAPAWKADAANPPISAKKAILSTTAYMKTLLRKMDVRKWGCVAADLCDDEQVDRWYWKITFEDGEVDGFKQNLVLVVLMNGKVVKAKVHPLE